MFYISSKNENKYGVTDTNDMKEEFYTMNELQNCGVSIAGVPLKTKDSITIEQLLKSCDLKVRWHNNEGYSRSQEAKKSMIMRLLGKEIKSTYPEYPFELKEFQGVGYYSCYSDFRLCLDNVDLIGMGTHSSTIQRAQYRAELYNLYKEKLEKFYGVSMLTLGINEFCAYYKAYKQMLDAVKKVEEFKLKKAEYENFKF